MAIISPSAVAHIAYLGDLSIYHVRLKAGSDQRSTAECAPLPERVTDFGAMKCVCAGKRIAAWSDGIRKHEHAEPPARISKHGGGAMVGANANETWA